MIRWLRYLWTGFWEPEEWEIYLEQEIVGKDQIATGRRFIMRSKRTGLIRKIDT